MIVYIVAGEFTNSISMVKDGLTHRYYGLYWQLIEMLYKDVRKAKAFWYSTAERRLYIAEKGKAIRMNLLKATLVVLKAAFNSASPVIVIIDYPHSFRGFKFLLEYVTFLLFLHFIKKLSRILFLVICDNMDPPSEHSQALGRELRTLELLMWIFLNKLTLSFDIILVMSEGYKIYLSKQYKIPLRKIIVIPAGTFVEHIPYIKPTVGEKLVVVYAGNLDERLRTLGEQILCAISELKSKGYNIEFIITGKNLIGNLKCIENARFLGGLDYSYYLNILTSSHAFLLLYPKCLHNDLVTFTKFSDYMSAGRVIVSTKLLMTANIINNCSCGFIFTNIDEFKKILEEIYNRKFHIIEDMSLKARKWAERNSYRFYVEKLINTIYSILRDLR